MINSSTSDRLGDYLKKHGLYEALHEPLKDCTFEDLEKLQMEKVNEKAKDLKLKVTQKLKFRRLMQIIISERDEIEISSKLLGVKADDKMTVVLVGDMGVGKTGLMRKYVTDKFDEKITSSVAVDKMINLQRMSDNTNMEISIWDTAGQERLQSIGRQYYRRADCILFCYDLSTEHPFENVDHWKTQIREYALEEVLVMFIGCKYDLVTNEERLKMHRNKVKEIMQQEEWKEFQPISCECSAKTNHNINGVFIACAELVLKDRKSKPCEIKKVHANNVVLNAQDVKQADPKSRGCCG